MNWFQKSKIKDLLRPVYWSCVDVFDLPGKKRLKKNIALKNLHEGKRAFLVLTGESIQQIDIAKLKDEFTFGVGYIFLHENIDKMGLTYYMNPERWKRGAFHPDAPHWPKSCLGPIGDEGISRFYQEIDKRLGDKTTLFLHSDNFKYIQNNSFFKDKMKYFIKGKKNFCLNEKIPYEITADLTKRSIGGGGSFFFSILIMMYMGFKEIYLCGAGYTYEPVYMFHFYDNFVFPENIGRVNAETQAEIAIENVNKKASTTYEFLNFFEKDNLYRGVFLKKVAVDPNKEKHELLNNYAKSQGVKIYNIVPNGFGSPIYQKISWQDVKHSFLEK